MFRTDERRIRIQTGSGFAVDGVVRIRRLGFKLGSGRVTIERHEPVAVFVERAGAIDRVSLGEGRGTPSWLGWVAVPLAAAIVSRTLRGPRKKDG